MNKKTIRTFLFLILYSFSSLNSMDNNLLLTPLVASTAIAYSLLIKSKQSKEISNFWIKTQDDQIIGLTDDMVNHCKKLHLLGMRYHPNNTQNNPLLSRFTSDEINIFLDALRNPTTIDYDKNLNLIMTIAEKFGAYIVYAWCVSNYLSQMGGTDVDENKIVPFLKKLTDNDKSDFILSKMVSLKNLHFTEQDIDICDVPFVESKDYYLVSTDDLYSPIREYRNINQEEYIIFDKNKNEVYRFISDNLDRAPCHWTNKKPYLFKEKNMILFYKYEQNIDFSHTITLYDFINKKELATFSGQNFNITSNEKYIGIISNDSKSLDLYNIENVHDIKYKKIKCQGKIFSDFAFNFDNNHLITVVYDEINSSVFHWNLSDFDWNNKDYFPIYTILENNLTCRIGQLHNLHNNLLITKTDTQIITTNCNHYLNYENHIKNIDFKNQKIFNYNMKGQIFRLDKNNLIIQFIQNDPINTCAINIYHIKDLSYCLYRYENKFTNYNDYINYYCNSSYLGINLYQPTSRQWCKSLLLKYDSVKNSIIESIHTIKGEIFNLNEKGWVLTSSYNCNSNKIISLYDNKGKKVVELNKDNVRFGEELSSKGHDLKIFKNFWDMSLLDKAYYLYKKNIILGYQLFFKASLYTQEELDTCNTLYNKMNCQQYAFCDTICSANTQLSLHKNPLLKNMLNSFKPKKKSFLENTLKIEY